MEQENIQKRKRGRPKGSNTKVKTAPLHDSLKRKRGRPAKTELDYRKQLFSNSKYERLYNLLPKYEFMSFGNVLELVKSSGINGAEDVEVFASKFVDLTINADLQRFKWIEVERDDGGKDGIVALCLVEFRLALREPGKTQKEKNT